MEAMIDRANTVTRELISSLHTKTSDLERRLFTCEERLARLEREQ